MPLIPVTRAWSAAIVTAPGDVVQNQGKTVIYLCPGATADRANAYELAPHDGVRLDTATQVFVATLSRRDGLAAIIRGT